DGREAAVEVPGLADLVDCAGDRPERTEGAAGDPPDGRTGAEEDGDRSDDQEAAQSDQLPPDLACGLTGDDEAAAAEVGPGPGEDVDAETDGAQGVPAVDGRENVARFRGAGRDRPVDRGRSAVDQTG